jgi:diacylglycerol kinase
MVRKFGYAFNGIHECFETQSSFRIMVVLASVAVLLGLFLVFTPYPLSGLEWIALVLAISGPLGGEAINTSLEKACDLFSAGWLLNEIRVIKDVAAGGVFMLGLGSLGVGISLFVPRLLSVCEAAPKP